MSKYEERDCKNCIFHDERCTKWDCNFISREEAEEAVEKVRKGEEDER